jgi:hypothetical protein
MPPPKRTTNHVFIPSADLWNTLNTEIREINSLNISEYRMKEKFKAPVVP